MTNLSSRSDAQTRIDLIDSGLNKTSWEAINRNHIRADIITLYCLQDALCKRNEKDITNYMCLSMTTKIRALAELKQSMLHHAFTCELTADTKAADRSLSEARV